jgi:hypothetical protein
MRCFLQKNEKSGKRGQREGKGQRAKGKGMVAFLALLEKQTAIILFCLYDPLLVLNL